MSKFAKTVGVIAFCARAAILAATAAATIFQHGIIATYMPNAAHITIIPWGDFFSNALLLALAGILCFRKKGDTRNRALIALYFHILAAFLFWNPMAASVSMMLASTKGAAYIAAKSALASTTSSLTYMFHIAGNAGFYMAAGSMIATPNDSPGGTVSANASEKSRARLVLYSGLLGFLGIDRFYAGKIATGIAKIFLALFSIASIVLSCSIQQFPFMLKFLPFIGYIIKPLADSLGSSLMKAPEAAGSLSSALSALSTETLVLILMALPYIPIIALGTADFVRAVLGKTRDSEGKPISAW